MDPDRRQLRELFGTAERGGPGTQRAIRDSLAEFREEPTLRSLFENIRADEAWLEAIADRSYAHDNGFDKIVLETFEEPTRKLRLHIWDSTITPQESAETNVHNHRWNFCSTVLCGSFQLELYERDEEGTEFHEYEYSPGSGLEYSLQSNGTGRLRRTFDGSLPAGVDYAISHDIIHRTFVDDAGLTATLMLQGPERKPSTSVFSLDPLEAESRDVTELSPATLEEKLDRVLEAM